jgi:hypothetical protein
MLKGEATSGGPVDVEESRSDVLGDTNIHMQGPSQIEKKGAHVQDDIKCG